MPNSPAEIRSLRIDGLLPTMDPVYLFNCFYDNAEVLATTVLRNCQTGNQEDYGFVEFASESVAKFVLNSYGGEPMPNYNNNNRYRLNWDYDGFGTRWRWDPAFKCCSFFGCDKWGKEFDANAVIHRYKDSIPVEPFPAAAGQHAAYQNAFPNNIENQLHHTQRHGSKRLKLLSPYPDMYEGGVAADHIYQHPGPILTIPQQNQLVQTQWNGGCGAAGFSPNMIHLHHINMSHGGLAGYVNYQQHDLYPQAGYVNYQQHDLYPPAGFANYQQHDLYPQAGYVNFQQHDHYRQTCAYQPPYQQLQTRCTVGSDTLTHELVTQVTKRDLKRKCSIKEKEKEKELYLCFRELNWVRKTCYVFRTIKLSELFACSCKLPDESDPGKCKYCAKTNKPKSQLRQRAWLYAGEKVPASCGGEKARIPVRMGCCVSGSQFFFAGGENRTSGKYEPSGDVYSFVPESTSWQKHDWSFQKGKPDPMLLEVNGNFYCLAGKTIACALEKPTFEVYNSSTRDCEPLPDPPFHLLELESGKSQHCWCSKNLAYAVVGTKILVSSTAVHEPFTDLPISCFDVKDEEKKWRDMPTLFDGKPFPFDGRALVLDLNGASATSDKVMFSFREKCFIYVSRLVENDNGDISISHDDCLEYFPEDILMPDLDAILSHDFVDLGNQKVGFVVCGTIYDWEEEDIDPHRKVRVVVVVIHYGADPEVPGLLSNEIQSARCFEYKCHSPAIISSDLVGSFVV